MSLVFVGYEYVGRPDYRMIKIFLSKKSICLSNPTVISIRKELGLHSIVLRKKLRYKKGDGYKRSDNLIKQNFTVSKAGCPYDNVSRKVLWDIQSRLF